MDTARLDRIYKRISRFLTDPRDQYIVVSVEKQTLLLCKGETVVERYNASTSRFGIGNRPVLATALLSKLSNTARPKTNGHPSARQARIWSRS